MPVQAGTPPRKRYAAVYRARGRALLRDILRSRYLYLLLLPGLAYFILFHYRPMYGLLLAFKKYNARLGIWASPWVGLSNFQRLFITPLAISAIQNTIVISLSRLIFQFPAPILLALLIN
nr:sugar ABC transporter permease [Clostridia bacterium]